MFEIPNGIFVVNFSNFGIGGDSTQHLLWRAQNLNISDNIDCIVICCGTNNLNKNSPIEIVNGIIAIGNYFGNNPNISIIFGLLPRELATSSNRSTVEYVNHHLKNICNSKKMFFFY